MIEQTQNAIAEALTEAGVAAMSVDVKHHSGRTDCVIKADEDEFTISFRGRLDKPFLSAQIKQRICRREH